MTDQPDDLAYRLNLAHRARRAKEHQLDGVRRALCDVGVMRDDDPYSHADLADVIRQVYAADTDLRADRDRLGRIVRQVEGLRDQWIGAGPPIGTSISRWWDTHLAELNAALSPPPPGSRHAPEPSPTAPGGPL